MEQDQELLEKAEQISAQLQAEISAITAEYNDLIKQAGARAGVSLVTDITITIQKD